MKPIFKFFSMLAIFAITITLIGMPASQARADSSGWQNVGSPGFSAGAAEYTSLAFYNGTPYVAYQDYGNSAKATVMKYDGSSWVTVGSAGFSAGEADYTSLAFYNGTPYVAYLDWGNSVKATVMKYDALAGNWVTVGSAGFSAGEAENTSLAFDGSGNPYVAYRDDSNGGKATVMKYDALAGNWVTVGPAGFSAGEADYTSLAFDGSGTPYVAYGDVGHSHKATVMKYDALAGNWVTVGSADFSAGGAYYTSLAFDGSGNPYVAYTDGGNSYKATVMKYSGSSWVTVGSAGFSAGEADGTSLAFDGSGKPYVAYEDVGNSQKATVMKYNGSSWVTVGSAGFSAGQVDYTSLAFDGSGNLYVAYMDYGNGYKATVMAAFDQTPPTVTAFTATSPTNKLDIPITAFTASDDVGVTGYMITASSAAPLSTDPNWLASAPATYHVAGDGTYTLYPWAKDAAGNVSAVYGSPAVVTVNTTTPVLVSPASGSKVSTFRPAFKWLAVTGYTKYQIEVSKSSNLASPLVNATVTTLSYIPTKNLPANTKLYWSVRTVKSNGTTGAWTPYYYFTIGLKAPTLTAPANLVTGVAHKPTFKWQAVSGATTYTIQVSTVSNFSTMLINVKVSGKTYIPTITLLGNKVYYWRVMATGAVGSSAWSSVFKFTTTP
jgi:hypothetical protein